MKVYSVSVLVLGAALCLPFLSLIRNEKIRKAVGLAILLVYIYGNLNVTILGRGQYSTPRMKPVMFWSYRDSLKIADGKLRIEDSVLLVAIILNFLLYVPLGYILPFLMPSVFCPGTKGPRHHWVGLVRVMAVALVFSALTEAAQYYFRIGVFDFDDIWHNTLGAGAGFILYRIVMRLIPLIKNTQEE